MWQQHPAQLTLPTKPPLSTYYVLRHGITAEPATGEGDDVTRAS